MRRRRRYSLIPPVDAEHIAGNGYEFKPEHDLVSAGKLPLPTIEFLGTGTSTGTVEPAFVFKPEHDRVAVAAKLAQQKAERHAAFLAELERCNTLEGVSTGKVDHTLQPYLWKDVIPEPNVWEALTEFLFRINLVHFCDKFLAFGRGPLASYWLKVERQSRSGWDFQGRVLAWLLTNWRGEWNTLSDAAKLALVEHLAKQADRAEGTREALVEIALTLRRGG